MKKNIGIVLIGIVAVIAIVAMSVIGTYNGLVESKEVVDNKASDISVNLERRADLIPNLVKTVKGFTNHEDEIIKKVTDARKELMGAKDISEKMEANEKLTQELNNLMVVVENYPDLKSSQNFINLQDELAGTENRIAVSRRDYNAVVKEYNSKIKKFPTNMISGMFGFERIEYFEADDAKTEVPDVEF